MDIHDCESCRIEGSIASTVILDPDRGTATKMYAPPRLVSLLYWLAFQAKFPYQHNRAALEGHKLAPFITLVEGDSAAQEVVAEVRSHVREGESALVLLDGCHTRDHVRAELEAYGPLVGPGSYLVAMDGIKQDLKGAPRSEEDWDWNNPATAAREFAEAHPEFVLEDPPFAFNEACITERVTYWPNAFLKRLGNLDARL